MIVIDFGPVQDPIDEDAIEDMLSTTPRRCQLATQWQDVIKPPWREGKDWSVLLPFCATYKNAFDTMCGTRGYMRSVKDDRCHAFLQDTADREDPPADIVDWVNIVGQFVGIRDCLALSFALDYDRINGEPGQPQTRPARLRGIAKPYGGDAGPHALRAADELVDLLDSFLDQMTCYNSATAVVAMPPSDPEKAFDLPMYLAQKLAERRGLKDLTTAVTTGRARRGAKDLPLEGKLDAVRGTIEVNGAAVSEETMLIVDDLYQSGTSVNYLGMLLLDAGARKAFGLYCEKTCRNDDNTGGRL